MTGDVFRGNLLDGFFAGGSPEARPVRLAAEVAERRRVLTTATPPLPART